jgi:hypothetical protein
MPSDQLLPWCNRNSFLLLRKRQGFLQKKRAQKRKLLIIWAVNLRQGICVGALLGTRFAAQGNAAGLQLLIDGLGKAVCALRKVNETIHELKVEDLRELRKTKRLFRWGNHKL